MPQHDMIIANGSGAAVRADINDALAALGSTMKGPNAPPAPIAGMMWLDDDTPSASVWTLKIYDGADWISIATFDISANTWAPSISLLRLAAGTAAAPAYSFSGDPDTGIFQSAQNVLDLSAGGSRLFQINNAGGNSFAVLDNVLGQAFTVLYLRAIDASASNSRAGTVQALNENSVPVLSLDMAINTDGGSSLSINATPAGARNADRRVNRMTIPGSGPVTVDGRALQIQRGTEQATTSGVAIDFTGIPAGVRRITIVFNGVSTNGTSQKLVQIGNTSFVTSGYVSSGGAIAAASAGGVSSTAGFLVGNFTLAADAINGIMTLTNISGNQWLMSFHGGSSGGNLGAVSGGFLSLGGALDRIRITTANGTDAFDAGAVNIMWEF